MMLLPLLTLLSAFHPTLHAREHAVLRIHEGAPIHTRMTMNDEMSRVMEKYTECEGELVDDGNFFDFISEDFSFSLMRALDDVDHKLLTSTKYKINMLCNGGSHEVQFYVLITKLNKYPPVFSRPSYTMYVPLSAAEGSIVGSVAVSDGDTLVYNNERSLSFGDDKLSHFHLHANGSVALVSPISDDVAYIPMHAKVYANDFGSPQMHAAANVTFIPVIVTQVRNLRANVASQRYQIFEWDEPEYGTPEKYRLILRRGTTILADQEVLAHPRRTITTVRIGSGWDVTFSVTAITSRGETPSEEKTFSVVQKSISCVGVCSEGGYPRCFYDSYNSLVQFVDVNGPHCECFPGFNGHDCSIILSCAEHSKTGDYGGIVWPTIPVNQSAHMTCPYNDDNTAIARRCVWNAESESEEWEDPRDTHKCLTRTGLLVNIGMIQGISEHPNDERSLSAVSNYVQKVLRTPTFDKDGSVHYDETVARALVGVLEKASAHNFSAMVGNYTTEKASLLARLATLSASLPFGSEGLETEEGRITVKVFKWRRDEKMQSISKEAYIQLPVIDEDRILRVTWMQNASFFEQPIDSRNPVLIMTVEGDEPLSFTNIEFALKPFTTVENYTCVYWDETEKAWSTRGIRKSHSYDYGFISCETTHLSTFSLLPESMFSSHSSLLRDFAHLLPTVTSFVSIVSAIFLLFLAAIQRGPSIDYPLLLFLFLVFLIHSMHLVSLIAPQCCVEIGEPILVSPTIPLLFQFCVISVCALSSLIANSIYSAVLAYKKEKPEAPLCSPFCATVTFGIIVPGVCTLTTYLFVQNSRHQLTRVLSRLDWLFIINYLSPCVVFSAVTVALCIAALLAISHNCGRVSSSSYSLSPATYSATYLILLLALLLLHVVMFVFKSAVGGWMTIMFALAQLVYCVLSFVFAGYLFRLRYMQVNGDDMSTQSLERKRDISRALLAHVDTRQCEGEEMNVMQNDSIASALLRSPAQCEEGSSMKSGAYSFGRSGDAPTTLMASTGSVVRSLNGGCGGTVCVKTPSPPPLTLDTSHYGMMSGSMYERTPMVSKV